MYRTWTGCYLIWWDLWHSTLPGSNTCYTRYDSLQSKVCTHKKAHRQHFHSIRQKEGGSLTHLLARLRAHAEFREFRVVCPDEMNWGRQVDYSNGMVAGLVNTEHQNRILAEAATLTTLEQRFNRIVSLETTDKSTLYLHNTMHPLALSSEQRSNHKR